VGESRVIAFGATGGGGRLRKDCKVVGGISIEAS
jgi:hypothetical protein